MGSFQRGKASNPCFKIYSGQIQEQSIYKCEGINHENSGFIFFVLLILKKLLAAYNVKVKNIIKQNDPSLHVNLFFPMTLK